jgi:hypothetical protein
LKEIEGAVDSERKAQGKVDPALEKAIEQSKINLLAAQSKIGAFAVSVNNNLQEITDSAINLGATLAEMSFKFSAPVAMWVGAPLMTCNTLRGISDQWEMAQDGVSLATVTKMVEKHSQGREGITDNITSYGQYVFYSQMEKTFSVGSAKFHDFINIVGSANKDWSQYYKQRKQNTTIILSQVKGYIDEDYEKAEILKVLGNFSNAIASQNWVKAKSYCVVGSEEYKLINKLEDLFGKLSAICNDVNYSCSGGGVAKVIISGKFAKVSGFGGTCTVSCTPQGGEKMSVIVRGEGGTACLEKIGDSWKIYTESAGDYTTEKNF